MNRTVINSDFFTSLGPPSGFLLFFLVAVISIVILAIALYVIYAIALFKLCKIEKIENAWLAFIPIASTYIFAQLFDIAGAYDSNSGLANILKKYRQHMPLLLTLIPLGINIIDSIPIIGALVSFVVSIAIVVILFWGYYYIIKKYGSNPVLHLIISIVFLVYLPIYMLIIAIKASRTKQLP